MPDEPIAAPNTGISSTAISSTATASPAITAPVSEPPGPLVGSEPKGGPAEPKPGGPAGLAPGPTEGEPPKDGDSFTSKDSTSKDLTAKEAPEAYADFTLPEGTTLDEQSATEFKGLAKELDLTQEQAQKLLDFGGAKIRAMTDAPYNLWVETQKNWQAEVQADPVIGGTKFEQSIKTANEVFIPSRSNPFVSSPAEAAALRTALSFTGAGNNPDVVKLFVKMGKMLSEPGPMTGNPLRDTQDSLLAKMYPTMDEA